MGDEQQEGRWFWSVFCVGTWRFPKKEWFKTAFEMDDGELHGRMSATTPSEHFCLRVPLGGCNSGASAKLLWGSSESEGWDDFGIWDLRVGSWECLNLQNVSFYVLFGVVSICFRQFAQSWKCHVSIDSCVDGGVLLPHLPWTFLQAPERYGILNDPSR